MIKSEDIIKCPENYYVSERENEKLFICKNKGTWVKVNSTGSYIIAELIDGIKNVYEIINILAQQNDLDADLIKDDVTTFLNNLVNVGFGNVINNKKTTKAIITQEDSIKIKPGVVWIHPVGKCNLACPYCYFDSKKTDEVSLSVEQLKPLLDYLSKDKKNNEHIKLIISGGEPMLKPELIINILKEIRPRKCFSSITILSNGTVGNKEQWTEVMELVDDVQITIDGATAETNDILRSKGSFDKAIATVKMLKEITDKLVTVAFTPTSCNYHEMCEMVTLCDSLAIDHLQFGHFTPVGRGNKHRDLQISHSQMGEGISRVMAVYEDLKYKNTSPKLRKRKMNISFTSSCSSVIARGGIKRNCGIGLGAISIANDGKVYPCASLFLGEFCLGNIAKDNIEEILHKANDISDKWNVDNTQICKDCVMKYICGGGCRAAAYFISGNMTFCDPSWYDEDKKICRRRYDLEEAMWKFADYCTIKKNIDKSLKK